MQLGEFIKSSLLDIISAVEEAQHSLDESGSSAAVAYKGSGHQHGQKVEVDFDVAVTASAGAKADAGAGIKVVALKIGASGEIVTENTAVSRIKFKVPLHLPHRHE